MQADLARIRALSVEENQCEHAVQRRSVGRGAARVVSVSLGFVSPFLHAKCSSINEFGQDES